jgi:tRNA A-37 threonylcarbamoyl transferase component Bud32
MNDETRISPARPDAPTPSGAETAAGAAASPQAETLPQQPDDVARAQAFVAPPVRSVSVPGYDIIGELGRGGMGVVYKARQVNLNRIVALKMILAGGHADSKEIARFVAEAKAMADVRHPNVIQVFDSGETDGHPFMVIEFLAGGSLVQRLREVGKLPARSAAELVQKIARGVQAAHDRGIIHRDLKPHNVLLDATPPGASAGTWGEPKVMDFGLAKRDGAELTQTGAVMGTPAYMAPEQARGETKSVGRAADVWALGVILYECLCGSVPFRGSDPWSVIRQVVGDEPEPVTWRIAGVPRELDLICRKCLEKNPPDRYESAGALADDLGRFLAGEALVGPRTGVWFAARRTARRWGRPLLAFGVLVALIVAAWFLPSPLDWFRAPTPEPSKEHPEPLAETKDNPAATAHRAVVANEVEALRRRKHTPDRSSPHPLAVVPDLPPADHSQFKVLADKRIVDLRGWRALAPNDPAAECFVTDSTRRDVMMVAPTDELRIETRTTGRDVVNRAERPNGERARAFAADKPGADGRPLKLRHLVFDVREIPVEQEFTLRYTSTHWNSLQAPEEQWVEVIGAEGSVKSSVLILFPDGRPFRDYRLRFGPTQPEPVNLGELQPYTGPLITFTAEDKSWLYWEIPGPKTNTLYRLDWTW